MRPGRPIRATPIISAPGTYGRGHGQSLVAPDLLRRKEDDRSVDWMKQGNCIDVPDPDVFFPSVGVSAIQVRREICGPCPVKQECLEYGAAGESGIWGGVVFGLGETQAERRAKVATGPIDPQVAPPKPKLRPRVEICKKGLHPRVGDERQCIECKLDYNREYQRNLRAERKAMA